MLPELTEQQKTVQPDEQLASGPHTDAYAVPGRNKNFHGFNASADPTSVERNKKLRRLDLLESPRLTTETTFSEKLMPAVPRGSWRATHESTSASRSALTSVRAGRRCNRPATTT